MSKAMKYVTSWLQKTLSGNLTEELTIFYNLWFFFKIELCLFSQVSLIFHSISISQFFDSIIPS